MGYFCLIVLSHINYFCLICLSPRDDLCVIIVFYFSDFCLPIDHFFIIGYFNLPFRFCILYWFSLFSLSHRFNISD